MPLIDLRQARAEIRLAMVLELLDWRAHERRGEQTKSQEGENPTMAQDHRFSFTASPCPAFGEVFGPRGAASLSGFRRSRRPGGRACGRFNRFDGGRRFGRFRRRRNGRRRIGVIIGHRVRSASLGGCRTTAVLDLLHTALAGTVSDLMIGMTNAAGCASSAD